MPQELPWFKKFKWIEVIGILFVIVQTGIFWQQCSISRGQSTQSDSLFAYTKRRDAFQDSQNTKIDNLRDSLLGRQSSATESLFVAARKSANAAQRGVEISAKSFAIGDRPYLTFESPNLVIDTGKGEIVPRVKMKNTGKTPAIDVIGAACVFDVKSGEEISSIPDCKTTVNDSKIFLGSDGFGILGGGSFIMKDKGRRGLDDILNGNRRFYIFGKVEYREYQDTKTHAANFCFYMDRKMKITGWTFYSKFNDGD